MRSTQSKIGQLIRRLQSVYCDVGMTNLANEKVNSEQGQQLLNGVIDNVEGLEKLIKEVN